MEAVLKCEEPAPGVLLLTLNRPARRNAIDPALCAAMREDLTRFRDEEHWRAAIITGAAPAFCAGLDLTTYAAPDAPRHQVTALITSIPDIGKPVIAAVNGVAYTGGLELALACDFIVASEDARFADTHAKIGALSGSGMGSRLPRAVGARFARQMTFTAAPIDAQAALRVGLVNEVLPRAALLPHAIELAAMIADHDSAIVRIAKSVIDRGTEATLSEAIAIEREALARRKAGGEMTWRV